MQDKRSSVRRTGSLKRTMTALIIGMLVVICAIVITVGYFMFKRAMTDYYVTMGTAMASVAGRFVDADRLDGWLETGVTDEEYERTLEHLRNINEASGVLYVYVFKAVPDGIDYIFDADPLDPYMIGDHNDADSDGQQFMTEILAGGKVEPSVAHTPDGYLLTVAEPLYGSDGKCRGYVGIDFDMNGINAELARYLRNLIFITVGATSVLAYAFIYMIRKRIITPINCMAQAADGFLLGDDTDSAEADLEAANITISNLRVDTGDELQILSESLKSMQVKINDYIKNLNIQTVKAETDMLTKLYNRDAFRQSVKLHLKNNELLSSSGEPDSLDAFFMIDVDYFKKVNDTYGHGAGDKVLEKCAAALKKVIRSSDVAGRQGGDEFVVFCKNVGSEVTAERKAKQILEAWAKISQSGEAYAEGDIDNPPVTASIGISFSPQSGRDFNELYIAADKALYVTKQNGRNGYSVYNG